MKTILDFLKEIWNASPADPNEGIKELQVELRDAEKQIEELNDDLAKKNATIDLLHSTVEELDAKILEQNVVNDKFEEAILSKDEKIAEQDIIIANLQPKGNIALMLTNGSETELKWVDKNDKLQTNFQVYEFMQNDGLEFLKLDQEVIDAIQKIREHFNKPVTITSAYRSKSYNASIGGATKSQHIYGRAIDFTISGVAIKTITDYIQKNWKELGVRGLELNKSWVHIDVRESNTLVTF